MYERSLANVCGRLVAIHAHVHASAFSNTSMRTAPSSACVQRLSTANWSPSSCHATALSDRCTRLQTPSLHNMQSLLHIPGLHNRVAQPSLRNMPCKLAAHTKLAQHTKLAAHTKLAQPGSRNPFHDTTHAA